MILDQQEIGQQITVSSVGGGSGVGGGSMMPGTSSSFQSSCVTFISLTAACKLVVGSLKKEKGETANSDQYGSVRRPF